MSRVKSFSFGIGLSLMVLLAIGCTKQSDTANPSDTNATSNSENPPIAFAIHGGAGDILRAEKTEEEIKERLANLDSAVETGYAILKAGGSSLDAVEAAIRILEDAPLFNAGKGAVATSAGTYELDASIMDGSTLSAGAVASLKHVKNPISLARLVMTNSRHVMMIGEGAEEFAKSQGIELVPNSYFHTEGAWKTYERIRDSLAVNKKLSASLTPDVMKVFDPNFKYGTVGAVALDKKGNLAAGTSTGGTTFKMWGRVGDSPIIGAGTYASNKAGCAVSSTGTGEFFIRNTISVDICKRVEYLRESIDAAATYVIKDLLVSQKGDGGVVVINKAGHVVHVFNTPGMYRAYIDASGKKMVQMFEEKK